MKTLLFFAAMAASGNLFAQANTKLSNLDGPTAVNRSLIPGTTNTKDLGTINKQWKNLYLRGNIFKENKRFLSNPGIGNTFLGIGTGANLTSGQNNTAIGDGAFNASNFTSENTAVGTFAMSDNTTGHDNTAVGRSAMHHNTTGIFNTATGTYAMAFNTTGRDNTAVGFNAMIDNTTGNNNAGLGSLVLQNNIKGSFNVAIGYSALNNTNTNNNTGVGTFALTNNNTGSNNTAVGTWTLALTKTASNSIAMGHNAGSGFENGGDNVFLGANADVSGAGFSNVISIGQGTICHASNQVTIGNNSTNSYRVFANWANISDGRFKKNMKEDVPGLQFINRLRPVTYILDATGADRFLHRNTTGKDADKQISAAAKAMLDKALKEKEQIRYTGFVAQEVEKAAKELNYDFSGVDAAKNENDFYGLRYAEFVVPLVKAVQELDKKHEEAVAALQKENETLNKRILKLEAIVNGQPSANDHQQSDNKMVSGLSNASLENNVPNPFNNTTTIHYTLPLRYSSAKIIITDKTDKALKEIPVSGSGKGNVGVNVSTLANGIYNYSLVIDGKRIDTKQMLLLK